MRFLVGGFHIESNSFSSKCADKAHFKISQGTDLIEQHRPDTNTQLSGIIAAISESGGSVIPSTLYSATSSGPVLKEIVDEFLEKLLRDYDNNNPIDGIFLDLHGATDMVQSQDCCGYILKRIRQHVGDNVVIAHGSDLHANITSDMAENSDVIAGYHTYPHDDYFSTGYRAALQGLMILRKEKLYQARVRVPMIVPAESYNSNEGVFAELLMYAKSLVSEKRILDFSIYQMQPWLNLKDVGGTVLVTAQDRETASFYAKDIAHRLFALRHQMSIYLHPIKDVFTAARENTTTMPVILVDSADSPNAGSSGDSSYVLSQLCESGEDIKACLMVVDEYAAQHAFEVGVGNTGEFSLGGRYEPRFQKPLMVKAYVRSLHDGKHPNTLAQKKVHDTGKTAVLQIGNIDIAVCSKEGKSTNPRSYEVLGINPREYQLVVVKSATQYKTEYSKFTTLFYPTDTPGSSTANLISLPYINVNRPLYPLDNIEDFEDTVTFVGDR